MFYIYIDLMFWHTAFTVELQTVDCSTILKIDLSWEKTQQDDASGYVTFHRKLGLAKVIHIK